MVHNCTLYPVQAFVNTLKDGAINHSERDTATIRPFENLQLVHCPPKSLQSFSFALLFFFFSKARLSFDSHWYYVAKVFFGMPP